MTSTKYQQILENVQDSDSYNDFGKNGKSLSSNAYEWLKVIETEGGHITLDDVRTATYMSNRSRSNASDDQIIAAIKKDELSYEATLQRFGISWTFKDYLEKVSGSKISDANPCQQAVNLLSSTMAYNIEIRIANVKERQRVEKNRNEKRKLYYDMVAIRDACPIELTGEDWYGDADKCLKDQYPAHPEYTSHTLQFYQKKTVGPSICRVTTVYLQINEKYEDSCKTEWEAALGETPLYTPYEPVASIVCQQCQNYVVFEHDTDCTYTNSMQLNTCILNIGQSGASGSGHDSPSSIPMKDLTPEQQKYLVEVENKKFEDTIAKLKVAEGQLTEAYKTNSKYLDSQIDEARNVFNACEQQFRRSHQDFLNYDHELAKIKYYYEHAPRNSSEYVYALVVLNSGPYSSSDNRYSMLVKLEIEYESGTETLRRILETKLDDIKVKQDDFDEQYRSDLNDWTNLYNNEVHRHAQALANYGLAIDEPEVTPPPTVIDPEPEPDTSDKDDDVKQPKYTFSKALIGLLGAAAIYQLLTSGCPFCQ